MHCPADHCVAHAVQIGASATNRIHSDTCFNVHVTGLPSHNFFLLRQYTSGLHIAVAYQSHSNQCLCCPCFPTPCRCVSYLCHASTDLRLSLPMRIVCLRFNAIAQPYLANTWLYPVRRCLADAPLNQCQQCHYCSLMTSYWKAPCPAFLH